MKRLDLPDHVKIGPYRYGVQIESEKFLAPDGYTWRSGEIDYNACLIRVVQRAPHPTFETLIHEALHAIDFAADTDLSEAQVSRLSPWLAAFLIDNGFVEEPKWQPRKSPARTSSRRRSSTPAP